MQIIYHSPFSIHSPHSKDQPCWVATARSAACPVWGLAHSLVPQEPLSSTKSPLPGPACTTDINTVSSDPWVTSAIILICSSGKTTASQISLLHELWASNRNELFPSSFHSFLSQQRVLAKLWFTDCTGIEQYILGQVENMFLLKLSFYSLTLNLTPAFSTKPFPCMSARFQAIWALLLNTVFEILRLVPNRKPPSPGWGCRFSTITFQMCRWTLTSGAKIGVSMTLVRWSYFPPAESIWTAFQTENIFKPWYYNQANK